MEVEDELVQRRVPDTERQPRLRTHVTSFVQSLKTRTFIPDGHYTVTVSPVLATLTVMSQNAGFRRERV